MISTTPAGQLDVSDNYLPGYVGGIEQSFVDYSWNCIAVTILVGEVGAINLCVSDGSLTVGRLARIAISTSLPPSVNKPATQTQGIFEGTRTRVIDSTRARQWEERVWKRSFAVSECLIRTRDWTTRHTPRRKYEHFPFAGRSLPYLFQVHIDMGHSSQ